MAVNEYMGVEGRETKTMAGRIPETQAQDLLHKQTVQPPLPDLQHVLFWRITQLLRAAF